MNTPHHDDTMPGLLQQPRPHPVTLAIAMSLCLSVPAATASAQSRAQTEVHQAQERASSEAHAEVSAPSSAQNEEFEPEAEQDLTAEELRELEAALGADAEDDTQSTQASTPTQGVMARSLQNMNPDISLILDVAAAGFSAPSMQTGAHDPSRNGFNLQQLEMHIESSVDPFFELQANIVFAQFGVEVEEAYARTLSLPGNLQARAGQFLTRMGRLNPTHPHSWQFLDQPLINGKFFGGEGSRGLGAELSYLTPLPWFVELTASSTMADGACCARSFLGGQDTGVQGPGDLLYTTRMAQFFELTPALSLMWGLSAQFGPNPTGRGNRTEIYASDLYLRWRPLDSTTRQHVTLQVEGMHRRRQVPGEVLVDSGGYAQLVWQPYFRYDLGARAEFVQGIENDPLDEEWSSARHRIAAQATLYPSHFSRLRLQVGRDTPTWQAEPIWTAMLGLEVLIGAHGAHAY